MDLTEFTYFQGNNEISRVTDFCFREREAVRVGFEVWTDPPCGSSTFVLFLFSLLFFLFHSPFLVCRSTVNNHSNNLEHTSAFSTPEPLCTTLQQTHSYRRTPLIFTHSTQSRQKRGRQRTYLSPQAPKQTYTKNRIVAVSAASSQSLGLATSPRRPPLFGCCIRLYRRRKVKATPPYGKKLECSKAYAITNCTQVMDTTTRTPGAYSGDSQK